MESGEERNVYGCEVMWGDDKAGKIQRLIEESTGGPCPCKGGGRCPMLPVTVKLPMPRSREVATGAFSQA